MSQEVELKLEVDSRHLPLIRQDPVLARAECRSANQVTVYYDTPEAKLEKYGLTLRVRKAGGRFVQTVKPMTGAVGLMSREELESEVKSFLPDLRVLSGHPIHRLVSTSGAKQLKPRVRCDVNRTSWIVDGGASRMQVDFDEGSITAGERTEEFAELEFELLDGPPPVLVAAAKRLSDSVPVRLGVLTKAERGFRLAAGTSARVTKAAPVEITTDMTVARAFQLIVHACLKQYRLNEPLVISGRNPKALHQARVAMRRLRSAFSLFRPAIEDVEYQYLRHELRWFTAQLGDARNLDVYLERDLVEDERSTLRAKREKAYDGVIDAMNSAPFCRLLIDIVGWVAMGAWREGKIAARKIGKFANRRLDRLWKSIERGKNVARMSEDRRHRLRIQAKKMRYAVEFLQGLYPQARTEEKHFASAIEELQESLGKLNDMVTARTFGSKPANDDWLIGSVEERRHLIIAEDALRELNRIGRFWRLSADSEHKQPVQA